MFHPRNCPHDSAPAQPQRERKTPTRSHTRGGPLGQFSLAFLAPATNNECPVAATFGNAKNHKCNSISCQSVCAQCSDTTSSVQPIQNAMDKMQHEMENRQLKTHEMQTRNGALALAPLAPALALAQALVAQSPSLGLSPKPKPLAPALGLSPSPCPKPKPWP